MNSKRGSVDFKFIWKNLTYSLIGCLGEETSTILCQQFHTSYRHGKVKTSKVSHQETLSSQFAVLMPAGVGTEEQKGRKTRKGRFKMKDVFHFHLKTSTAFFVTVSVPDQLQISPLHHQVESIVC